MRLFSDHRKCAYIPINPATETGPLAQNSVSHRHRPQGRWLCWPVRVLRTTLLAQVVENGFFQVTALAQPLITEQPVEFKYIRVAVDQRYIKIGVVHPQLPGQP